MLRPIVVAVALFSAAAAAGGPRHLTLRRTTGASPVRDCYVWEEIPNANHNSDTLYVGLVGTTDKRSLLWFDVPKNVRVLDARLELIVDSTGGIPFRVHEVTKPWMETEPTWSTFATSFKPGVEITVTPSRPRVSIDLTALVRSWAEGAPNNGIMLEQDTLTAPTAFESSEHALVTARPSLELVVEDLPPGGGLDVTEVPQLEASCGVQLRYPLSVHAPSATSFSSTATAGGPVIDADSGELVWTPTRTDRGVHTWAVDASDGVDTVQMDVTVDVKCAEHLRVGCGAAPGAVMAIVAALLALRRRARPRR